MEKHPCDLRHQVDLRAKGMGLRAAQCLLDVDEPSFNPTKEDEARTRTYTKSATELIRYS
jgi:hypothetical protein